jgi:apolipoprotein N-acyltransferase
MSTSHESFRPPLSTTCTLVWAGVAVAAFHLFHEIAALSCLVGLYVFSLVQLTRVATPWRALFTGWLAGLFVFGPQLAFMFDLFGMFGVVLWLIGSFLTGLFVLLGHLAIRRVGRRGVIFLRPLFFIALEYVRSELYWLKFSWLAPGYTFAGHGQPLFETYVGVYGVGFVLVLTAALLASFRPRVAAVIGATLLVALGALANLVPEPPINTIDQREGILVVGIQMEFPSIGETVYALDSAVKEHPDVDLVVLSEYTFKGRPPSEVLRWCRQHECYLVAGGKEPVADRDDAFRNTAFVISPKGDVVFKQAKSVPIPFFADGLPADEQQLWNSPWGKIGICICYDLSYTRVVDELVR